VSAGVILEALVIFAPEGIALAVALVLDAPLVSGELAEAPSCGFLGAQAAQPVASFEFARWFVCIQMALWQKTRVKQPGDAVLATVKRWVAEPFRRPTAIPQPAS